MSSVKKSQKLAEFKEVCLGEIWGVKQLDTAIRILAMMNSS